MCCGFLDLSLEQFMTVQKQLLLEQIGRLNHCQLGRKLMRGAMPETVEEFRREVPLTTYIDYCPELLEKREDVLPAKPFMWIQTSGRSGEYPFKWVPVSHKSWEEAGLDFCAIAIFSSCKARGEVPFKHGYKLLHAAAQPPFLTGLVASNGEAELGFQFLPPVSESEKLGFEERVEKGFKLALSDGMDGFFGLAGVLVAIGEKFKQGSGHSRSSRLLLQPKVALRLARGLLRSKIAGRAMLPRDLWSLKMITSMGVDSVVYKEKIKELWGREPLNVFGNSETIVVATQTWDYDGMVFFPNLNFLEFMPETEHAKWQADHSYHPKTVLLDEVKSGECYELVITNFHGGIMTRYRLGDMVRITSLRNARLGINLPQMVFERRADDLIDLGFVRLTERVIWQAIENAGIPNRGWLVRKEVGESPKAHVYLELSDNYEASEESLSQAIYEQIKQIDDGLYVYKDLSSLEGLINFRPIEVSLLPKGAFAAYKERQRAAGASLAHFKPPHVNPPDKVLAIMNSL